MRDFPPEISTFYSAAGRKPGPAPDTRTPAALLRWFLRMQWHLILLTTAVGVLWQLPLTLGPWIFGKAIDDGIEPESVERHADLGRAAAARHADRRVLRHRHAHPDRARAG